MKLFKPTFIAALTLIASLSAPAFAGWIQNEDVKSLSDLETSAGTITGNLSSSSVCIASPSSITGLASGMYAYDQTTPANIASGVTITAIPGTCSAGQIQLSATSVGTATGDSISFGGQASSMINISKLWDTINLQALSATISAFLPSMSGQSGKYLSTNGTAASWATLGVSTSQLIYRRPNLIFNSTSEVDIEANSPTANTSSVYFSDGTELSVTESTPTSYRAMKIGQVANWTSVSAPQGGLRTGSAAQGWYAVYAVKCTGSGQTSNFVAVADTVLPLQANFATLNTNFGPNGWAYLGLVRYGDNGGSTTSILDFVQNGDTTVFRNTLSNSYTFSNPLAGVLLSAQNGSAAYTQYTYSAGTGNTNLPNNISLAQVSGTWSYGVGGVVQLFIPTSNGGGGGPTYFTSYSAVNANESLTSPFLPVNRGWLLAGSGGSTGQFGMSLSAFKDNVLSQGGSPQL